MIRKVAIRDAAADLIPLVRANGKEILGDEFNPSYEQFLQLEDQGALRTFLFGEKGYTMFVVSPLILQKHIISANCIALYVVPEARTLSTFRVLKQLEKALFSEGLDQIQYQADPRYSALFERLGYKHREVTFIKEHSWRQVSQ